jgi:hypothetical protein
MNMCASEYETTRRSQDGTRVAVVDNWHEDWPIVLESIDRHGHRDALMLDGDGWISARQSVIAAFVDRQVAGHLCFRLKPVHERGAETIIDAHVDCVGVNDATRRRDVVKKLQAAAQDLARTLKVRKVYGLEDLA